MSNEKLTPEQAIETLHPIPDLVRKRYAMNEQAALNEFHDLPFYDALEVVLAELDRLRQPAAASERVGEISDLPEYRMFRTCLNALALEVDPSIHNDIVKHFLALEAALRSGVATAPPSELSEGEREKALAVAGAYEAAAQCAESFYELLVDNFEAAKCSTLPTRIRALTPADAQEALEAHVREHVDRVTKNLMDALKDAGTVRRIEWIIPADQAAVAERLEAVRKVRDAMLVYKCDHDEYDHCDTEAMIWADKLTAALGEGSK